MADTKNKKTLLTKKEFLHISQTFANNFNMPIEPLGITGRPLRGLNCCCPKPTFCKLIDATTQGHNRCVQDRLRSMQMAFETGQAYISICHAGIFSVCVPVMDGDDPLGGLFFGKCLTQPLNIVTDNDIEKRLRDLPIDWSNVLVAADKLDIVPTRTIHEAAEFLYIILYQNTNLDPRIIKWQQNKTQQQARIGEYIQQVKGRAETIKYPYHIERELMNCVKMGDKAGAKDILNSILGSIVVQNPGSLNILKARVVELLSILCRSAAEAGVDINLLLKRNSGYISGAIQIDSQQDLCAWLAQAITEFIESVYEIQDTSRISRLNPVIDFIQKNYTKNLTIADIAEAAYLSPSRLAHVFKEQTGQTIIEYLNRIRINQAKLLLSTTDENCTQICFQVGYNNQSYFNRIFKKVTGVTPKNFRLTVRESN